MVNKQCITPTYATMTKNCLCLHHLHFLPYLLVPSTYFPKVETEKAYVIYSTNSTKFLKIFILSNKINRNIRKMKKMYIQINLLI